MANRDDHDFIGMLAGALTTLIASKPRDGAEALLALASGALVGRVASSLPDVIEPAHHPNHRAFAHSLVAAAGVVTTTLRPRAIPPALVTAEPPTIPAPMPAFNERLVQALLPAAGIGYLSHLALDAGTPKGLPII